MTEEYLVNNEVLLKRIVINPKVMVGKPVIRGTRLTVEYILGLLAHGTVMEDILQEYPGLEKDYLTFMPVSYLQPRQACERVP